MKSEGKTSPDLSEVLDVLRDRTRRLMLLRLLKGECPCCLFADLGPKTRLSYHYALLQRMGLVKMRKEGVAKYLSLCTEDIEKRFPGLLTSVLDGTRKEQSKCRSLSKLSAR